MNRLILVCLVAIGTFVAASPDPRETLVKWNRTPKVGINWTDACDECQVIIRRIAQIAEDPTKIAELQMLLGLLCKETSYEEECKLFVSNIQRFLDKLKPYLSDAHHVCHELRICGNSKLEQFHRVGMLYAKKYLNKVEGKRDLVCEECEFAAHELQTVIDDRNYQRDVKEFLSKNVCAHLGSYRGACDELLENFLPDLFQELHNLLNDNHQFCQSIELCPPRADRMSLIESVEGTSTGSKVSRKLLKHFLQAP